ncbi:MAG: hypothetical protein BWY57_02022 [Betaproteobacteria bacterium ADurb.Bin341]|nr:MAG: hypothetical protein BWY57_02022 [Betaproteobacteria bacterium ADurb.Bin341]
MFRDRQLGTRGGPQFASAQRAFGIGRGGLQTVTRGNEASLIDAGRDMQLGGAEQAQLASGFGARGLLHLRQQAAPQPAPVRKTGTHLLHLRDPDLSRIHRPPACEIIIRDADHGGTVAGGLEIERIGRPHVLRSVVERADVIGIFAETL